MSPETSETVFKENMDLPKHLCFILPVYDKTERLNLHLFKTFGKRKYGCSCNESSDE